MDNIIDKVFQGETESLCPVCLKRIRATRLLQGDEVFLVKECEDHGSFRTVMWRGKPSMAQWQRPKAPVHPELCYGCIERGCPFDCGLCNDHQQVPCSVLIEVTDRCNLNCAVCFADSGRDKTRDPSLERISLLLERAMAAVGPSNLQLSGGEPTLRDDLPQIVEIARQIGYTFIQVNTNGLRLASDKDYGKQLRDAGLSAAFLQFDGASDDIYRSLRGKGLLTEKLQAIRHCGEADLGVVLVPTLVRGVNTHSVGAIVRQALKLAPTVRGIHFQPVSFFGRFPKQANDESRFTLPELMRCLEEQTKGLIKVSDFSPPGCEHAHCSFHATYMLSAESRLQHMGAKNGDSCCSVDVGAGGVKKTVETVSRRWTLPSATTCSSQLPLSKNASCCRSSADVTRTEGPLDLDVFLREVAVRSFTISAMAFQDAENLDLERLRGCCISVISPDGKLIPFCAYNLTSRGGESLYPQRNGSRPP
jgi:uncharacterized radical SAM superfamily Fe-S cluster-containing enzyme